MTLRYVKGDLSLNGVTDYYGLNTFAEQNGITNASSLLTVLGANGTMNMLDIGGNYGLVTIAAFKMHPERMRIVTMEPMPSTYFLLKWNLYLNGIPELAFHDFQASSNRPGVFLLNNGISSTDFEKTGMCYTPPMTMNARVCDCEE